MKKTRFLESEQLLTMGLEKRKRRSARDDWSSGKIFLVIAAVCAMFAGRNFVSRYAAELSITVTPQQGFCMLDLKPLDEWDSGISMKEKLAGVEELVNSTSDPIVLKFATLIEASLSSWRPQAGIQSGLGKKGMVKQITLKTMGTMPEVMACCSHVIVFGGEVYYRYGGFLHLQQSLQRLHTTILNIQNALDVYGLRDLRAEFFINTCDWPLGYDNAMGPLTVGKLPTLYPVMSVHHHPASSDILYPDPLDLSALYMDQVSSTPRPKKLYQWHEKRPMAVFRSNVTNYLFREGNWMMSPRMRLHMMSDVRPDLLDARLTSYRAAVLENITKEIIDADIFFGEQLSTAEKEEYKYEVVVDGPIGAGSTCSVLLSSRAMLRQESEMTQFFDPLLQPGVHYMPTTRYFTNLFKVIEWARTHDLTVRGIVRAANEVARAACTWEGRSLYWALLLLKYQRAMEDPGSVKKPEKLCGATDGFFNAAKYPLHLRQCTNDTHKLGKISPCAIYCEKGVIQEDMWEWFTSKRLVASRVMSSMQIPSHFSSGPSYGL